MGFSNRHSDYSRVPYSWSQCFWSLSSHFLSYLILYHRRKAARKCLFAWPWGIVHRGKQQGVPTFSYSLMLFLRAARQVRDLAGRRTSLQLNNFSKFSLCLSTLALLWAIPPICASDWKGEDREEGRIRKDTASPRRPEAPSSFTLLTLSSGILTVNITSHICHRFILSSPVLDVLPSPVE